MSTRDDMLVGETEEELHCGGVYELSSPNDGTYVMRMCATDRDNDSSLVEFTRKELEGFIEQCKVYLTNPDY